MIKLKDLLNEGEDLTTAKAKRIGALTGADWEEVENFFYNHNVRSADLLTHLRNGSQKDKENFAKAMNGDKKQLQFFIKKFGRK